LNLRLRQSCIATLLLATSLALFPAVAEAQYLDPGAGSIIVQAVIAVFVGVAAAVKLYWRRLRGFLGRRPKGESGS
jgi:hypothetical protein